MADDPRQELLELILEHSFERRKVVLSSGKESDFYLDLRTTLMRPRGLQLAGELLYEKLASGAPVDSVGGMVVAAVPVVAAAASTADTSGTAPTAIPPTASTGGPVCSRSRTSRPASQTPLGRISVWRRSR